MLNFVHTQCLLGDQTNNSCKLSWSRPVAAGESLKSPALQPNNDDDKICMRVGITLDIPYAPYSFRIRIRIRVRITIRIRIRVRFRIKVRIKVRIRVRIRVRD